MDIHRVFDNLSMASMPDEYDPRILSLVIIIFVLYEIIPYVF